MRYLILLLLALSLTSCGVYQVSTTPKVKITKVLTVTSTGDTLAVPIKQFQRYNYNNIFDNYNFFDENIDIQSLLHSCFHSCSNVHKCNCLKKKADSKMYEYTCAS